MSRQAADQLIALLFLTFDLLVQRKVHLVKSTILGILPPNVFSDLFGISTQGVDEIPSGPEGLSGVIALFLQEVPRHVDRALALDVAHHTGY